MRRLEVKAAGAALGAVASAPLDREQPRIRRSSRVREPTVGRVLAALLGTLPVTVLAAALISRALPAGGELGFALAYFATIPLWTFLVCRVLVARTSTRAWTWCVVVSVAFASALYLVPQHNPVLRSSSPLD